MSSFDWLTIGGNILKPSSLLEKYDVSLEELKFQAHDFNNSYRQYLFSNHCKPSDPYERHFRFTKNEENKIVVLVEVDRFNREIPFAIDEGEKLDLNNRLFQPMYYSPLSGQVDCYIYKPDSYLRMYINFKSKYGFVTEISGDIAEVEFSSDDCLPTAESKLEPYEFNVPT